MNWLQPLLLRRSISTAIGILVAVLCDIFFSHLHEFWVSVTTILVMQISIKLSLRLAMQRFVAVIASVALSTMVFMYLPMTIAQLFCLLIFFIGSYLYYLQKNQHGILSSPLIIALVFLIMLAPYTQFHQALFYRLQDVLLGGVIALLAGLLIFPGRSDVDFRLGVIPILEAYQRYLPAVVHLLWRQPQSLLQAQEQKHEVERVLQTQQAFFPDWVYETGFNVALRQGHRHFLMRVEQVGEILFAMHHAARNALPEELLQQLREPLQKSVDDSLVLLQNLILILNLKTPNQASPDLTTANAELEEFFHRAVPLPLELLEMAPEFIYLAGFIQDLRDLQSTLLRLAEALRAAK